MFSIFCTHYVQFQIHIDGRDFCQNVLFQKTAIFLPHMGLEFPAVVVGKVSVRQKILKRCTVHVGGSIEISRGTGGLRKKSCLWGRYGYYFSGRIQSGFY